MKRLIVLGATCLVAAAAQAQQVGPEEAFDRYAQAINTGDLPAVVAVYSDDALAIWTTSGSPFMKGKAAIEDYYKGFFASTKSRHVIKAPGYQWQVFGDTAVRTSNGTIEVETDKGKVILPLRNTYVFHKEGQDWKIVNSHISDRGAPIPSPATAPSAAK